MPLVSRCLLSGILAGAALAAGPATAQTKSLDAHVHGQAELSFAAENDEIYVELHSPLINFAGFEHAPETAEQKTAYDAVIETLRAGNFLTFQGGDCVLSNVTLETPGFDDREEHDGAHHEHDHHDNDHHDDAHDHETEHAHADIDASYRYSCGRLDRLEEIHVGLFDRFEGTQEIAVVYLGETTRAATLTPGRNILNLDR